MVPAPKLSLPGCALALAIRSLHRLHLARRVDHEQLHGLGHQRDRCEVVDRVVGRRAVEVLVHGQRRVDRHQQRVAVGRAPVDDLRADHRVGAGRGSRSRPAGPSPRSFSGRSCAPARRTARRPGNGTTILIERLGKRVRPFLRGGRAHRQRRNADKLQCSDRNDVMVLHGALSGSVELDAGFLDHLAPSDPPPCRMKAANASGVLVTG